MVDQEGVLNEINAASLQPRVETPPSQPRRTDGAGASRQFILPAGAKSPGPGGWVRISMLSPGDILAIQTDENSYTFVLTGDSYAAMIEGAAMGREVRLLGCFDPTTSNISWGGIQNGTRLLFSDHGEETQATMTTTVRSIVVKEARTGISTSRVTPQLASRPGATPRMASPAARAQISESRPLVAGPRRH